MDRKRDAPIPWSVSLPCVAAVVALAFGWRTLGRRTMPSPAPEPTTVSAVESKSPSAIAPDSTPVVVAEPVASPSAAPVSTSVPTPTPAPPPQMTPATPASVSAPAPTPEPAKPKDSPVAKEVWTPLARFRAADLQESAQQIAPSVERLRDRAGLDGDETLVRTEASSRTIVVVAGHDAATRGEALVRALASFGERLDALVLMPARIPGTSRPWIVVFAGDAASITNALTGAHFAGVLADRDDHRTCREVAVRQLHAALSHGPDDAAPEWVVVGAVGAAASDSLADAVSLRDPMIPLVCNESVAPLPSLAELFEWRSSLLVRDSLERECLARLAASFVAYCLERGPKDPRAVGLFELLRIKDDSLPDASAAYDAEIAARLGATRLEELDAAWQAARR